MKTSNTNNTYFNRIMKEYEMALEAKKKGEDVEVYLLMLSLKLKSMINDSDSDDDFCEVKQEA